MPSTIYYNERNPFSGIATVPLFSRTIEMVQFGNRWAQKHSISLEGQLTGLCPTYSGFITGQRLLLSGFSRDLQSLRIYDSGIFVTGYDLVTCRGITFQESQYGFGTVPFQILLDAYPSGYFSGQSGILDPRDEFNFNEGDDGQVTLSHVVSARGLPTVSGANNNALTNARGWVAARTGWSSQVLPAFISGFTTNGVCLQTLAESYDRLNATYQVSETYLGNIYLDATNGFLRYSTDYSSGIDGGVSTVTVDGSIKGCRYQNISGLRARYSGFNAFNEAINQYRRITSLSGLNSNPLTKTVSEDSDAKQISFNYVFNNDLNPTINIVSEISFSFDFESDTISADISATVSSKAVYDANKWSGVVAVANGLNLYSILAPAYSGYVTAVAPHLVAFPLNPTPISKSRSENQFLATISLAESYSNASTPPFGLDTFSSSITFQPGLHKYTASPILDGEGEYYLTDLGFIMRSSCSIEAQGIGEDGFSPLQTLNAVKYEINKLMADNLTGRRLVLDAQSYTTGNSNFNKSVTANAAYSLEQPEFSLN